MAQTLNTSSLKAFEAVAQRAAAYLDACDGGSQRAAIDPERYRQCAGMLLRMFALFDPHQNFPALLQRYPAAQEIAETIRVGRLLATRSIVYYPQVAAIITRAAARSGRQES